MSISRESLTERAKLDGVDLEYVIQGSGEPVVLIHGGFLANYLSVLQRETALTRNYRLLSYSRRGFGGSTHHTGPFSVPEQASDLRKLMDYLNIKRAHMAGHSYGGGIAIQFALDYPEYVHSLCLMEPMLPQAIFAQFQGAEQFFQGFTQIAQMYQQGKITEVINTFLSAVGGPDAPAIIEKALPGALNQGAADLDTFFQVEMPASMSWNFAQTESKKIRQPIVFVGGAESAFPFAKQVVDVLSPWFPPFEVVSIPKTTHNFPISNPRETSRVLADFFARHPLQVIA